MCTKTHIAMSGIHFKLLSPIFMFFVLGTSPTQWKPLLEHFRELVTPGATQNQWGKAGCEKWKLASNPHMDNSGKHSACFSVSKRIKSLLLSVAPSVMHTYIGFLSSMSHSAFSSLSTNKLLASRLVSASAFGWTENNEQCSRSIEQGHLRLA